MARFSDRPRTQRYLLRGKARRAIARGEKPVLDANGKWTMNLGGRHYVLPDGLYDPAKDATR